MDHFYKNIFGYFNYEKVFKNYVERLCDGSTIVEVGCFLGKSSAFLATEILNSGKNIELYCIDTWTGMKRDEGENVRLNNKVKDLGGNAFPQFVKNLESVLHIIKPIPVDSIRASKLFEDKSIDIIFLDGDHTYNYLSKEISVWHPKIKDGGIISGHDYNNSGSEVNLAVDEYFGKNKVKTPIHNVWEVYN